MTNKDRLIIIWRSLLLQAGWNYLRFQGFGLAFTMLPFLKKYYKGKDLDFVLLRYMETFNTHPVMAAFAFGALAKAEESVLKEPAMAAHWRVVKTFLSSSLASVGDRLFWDTLKPLSLMLGIFIAFFFLKGDAGTGLMTCPDWAAFAVVLAVLVSYNLVVFIVKWEGLKISFHGNKENTFGLLKFNWNRIIKICKIFGFIMTMFLGIWFFYTGLGYYGLSPQFFVYTAMILLVFVVSGFAGKYDIPNVYIYLVLTLIISTAVYFI